MRGKLRSLCFGLLLLGSAGLALTIVSPAAAASIAVSKALRADDGLVVPVRAARGGHRGGHRGGAVPRGAAHRGASVRPGGTGYRGRAPVRRGGRRRGRRLRGPAAPPPL